MTYALTYPLIRYTYPGGSKLKAGAMLNNLQNANPDINDTKHSHYEILFMTTRINTDNALLQMPF